MDEDTEEAMNAWLEERMLQMPGAAPLSSGAGGTATIPPELLKLLQDYASKPTQYATQLENELAGNTARQQQLEEAVSQAYNRKSQGPSKSEMYFNLAQSFLSPNKSGRFTEDLGRAAGVGADYRKRQQEAAEADAANQRAGAVEVGKLRLGASKDRLENLRKLDENERKDRRVIMARMLESYLKSGAPQTEAEKYAVALGLQRGTPEYQAFIKDYITKAVTKAAGSFGGLQAGVDAKGNPVFLQADPRGGARPVEGFTPAPYDVGLVEGVAGARGRGAAAGKAAGEAEAALAEIEGSADLAIDTVTKLIDHPGFDTLYGKSGALGIAAKIPGTDAAGAQALLDQVLGQTFLNAFNSIKGGGAITEAEGKKATAALTRLQSMGVKDTEARQAARDLVEIFVNAKARARKKAASGRPSAEPEFSNDLPESSDLKPKMRYNPQTKALEPVQ